MSYIASYCEIAARYSLIVFAFLLPFFFFPGGSVMLSQGKMVLATALVACAAFLWCIATLFGAQRIPRHGLIAVAALIPIAYAISATTSGWQSSSIVSGLGSHDTVVSASLWFASLLVGAAIFRDRPRESIRLLRAFLIGTMILMLFQIAKLIWPAALSFGLFQNEASSLVGSWHDLGIVASVSVILSLLLSRTAIAAGLWKWTLIAVAALGLVVMFVVNMADIWYVFAAICALVALFTWYRPLEGVNIVRSLAFWLALAVISIALGYFGTTIHSYIPEPFKVVAIEVRPSWEGTFAIGRQTFSESRTLFFGSGPNSFSHSWALHKPLSVNTTDFWSFDFNAGVGVVPTAFVTLGLIGLIAWGLVSLGFLEALRRMIRRPQNMESRITTSLAAAILCMFVFHVTYAPGLAISMMLFLFLGVFIATLMSPARNPLEIQENVEPLSTSRVDMVGAGVAAILILVVAGVSGRALASDILVNKSVIAYADDKDAAKASDSIARALVLWPSNDRAHRAAVELGMVSLAEQAQSANDVAAQQKLQTTLSDAIQHGLTAVSINGSDYQNWLTLALLYQELAGAGVEGAYDQAKQAYSSARAENPTNPVPVFRLAQLETLKGNREGALQLLAEATQLKPNFAAAYYLGSQLYAQGQQYQEAAQAGAIAVQLVPQDPLGWYNLGTILYAANAPRDAAAAFSQAITLQPDYSNAIFMLSLAYAKLGETDASVSTMTRVKELNPDDPTLSRMIQNIQAKKDPFEGIQAQ